MPMGSVLLKPGVNTQLTPSLNEAGVSQSQLIRYKDGMPQKLGGWNQFYPITIGTTIHDMHAWQGLNNNTYLSVAGSTILAVIATGNLSAVTPQTRVSSFAPVFSVSSGSAVVTVIDAGSSLTTFDSVFFNTPVSVGTTILQGCYPINTVGGSSTYTVISTGVSNTTVVGGGQLPIFNTTANSGSVTVTLSNNNYQSIVGYYYGFYAPTTVGGITISGNYSVSSIIDSTQFTIVSPTAASSTNTATMNNGLVSVTYFIAEGPPPSSGGYGLGPYGVGSYGVGGSTSGAGGTAITATDWTQDNWGEILLACPEDGPIYAWSATSGFSTASVVNTAPMFNGGIFISMPQQILVAWRSCLPLSGAQDNLTVRWSDAGDFTNWDITSQTSGGSFHFPTGSIIVGGMQASNYSVIWTDTDAWIMQYVGGTVIFNFTQVGSGCGLIGKHAAAVLNNDIYWCGTNNIYTIQNGGCEPLPCTVWDFLFQNLNSTYQSGIRCAPNSAFNEITWYFPSSASTGENDAYIKYNIIEKAWDYGYLSRVAWCDVSPLGMPIGSDATTIYQHEMGYNNVSAPISSSFTSGYWSISEGNEMAFVDWILPDMKFGTYSGSQTASCQITFYSLDYTGDTTPRTYGPYTFTQATEYINTRIRGRFLSIKVETTDVDSFWRIGRIRYRWQPSGRR